MSLVIELHCLHQTKTVKFIWIFETKTVSIHAYIRIKLYKILEFLSQKKWQFVSRWGVLPAGNVRRLGVFAMCLASRAARLG